jgi:hypothetical protein
MLNEKKKKIVEQIFENFNKNNIPYVIYKNYQTFPEIGNDLDVIVDYSYKDKALKIFKNTIENSNIKLYCIDYNGGYNIPAFNPIINLVYDWIESFNQIICIRIEFFNGIYSAKSTLYTSKEMISDRIKFNDIYIPSFEKQLTILLLTVLKNIVYYKQDVSSLDKKAMKYIEYIKDFYNKNPEKSKNEIYKKLGENGLIAIESILKNDINNFIKYTQKAKISFLANEFLKRPFYVSNVFMQKFKWDIERFYFPKTGILYKTILHPQTAQEVKDLLLKNKIFREYLIIDYKKKNLYKKEIKITLGRGNFILYTSNKIEYNCNSFEIAIDIIKNFAKKQELIYEKTN